MKSANLLKAPKLSAALFLWKQNEPEFDDLYSTLINQCPDFAILAAKTCARKDYRFTPQIAEIYKVRGFVFYSIVTCIAYVFIPQ